jgi:phthalate 4,5-dioxygenase oxygenase subunit
MLSKEENELVTRVGPGTPTGRLMRRYWLPALLSTELPGPDCAPVRVKLLDEALVAFRDTNGRAGILEEHCPHRLASLFLGRNEERGLRCVYHGWKFDVEGNCLEQMNEPESFANKIHAVAYPVIEQGGVIWTYMGPAEKRPPAPDYEYTRVPASHRAVSKVWERCNWLQALEGGIDTSHAPILHRALKAGAGGIAMSSAFVQGSAPVLEVDLTDYGYRYTGIRRLGEAQQYVRGYHFVMPFTQLRPQQVVNNGLGGNRTVVAGHHWVPIDDHNCMVWNWHYSFGDEPLDEGQMTMNDAGNGPKHVDAAHGYRAYGNARNDWLLDRDRQKSETFTGIDGVNAQDRAVQESMGPIINRTREHLGPADKAIITARRLVLDAIRTVAEGGDPLGTDTSYHSIRAIEMIFARDIPWRDVLLPEMYPGEKAAPVTV